MDNLGTIGRRRNRSRLGGPLVWSFICLLLVIGSLRFFLGELVIVRGFHMAPNYLDGDLLIVGSAEQLKHGDVVVIGGDEHAVFRRVIGLPGDVVGSENGTLTRDGESLVGGACLAFVNPRDADRSRERTCTLELSSERQTYGTLGDYITPDRPWFFRQEKITVESTQIFVLPDDRKATADKGTMGAIPLSRVEGRVSSRVWRPTN